MWHLKLMLDFLISITYVILSVSEENKQIQ